MGKLVTNLFVDQLPGELKTKIKFNTPDEVYDKLYIYRRVDRYENGVNNIPGIQYPTFTRNSPAYLSDGTQVATNQPRFDVIDGVMGLMVEEETTNKILYSEEFDRSNWAKSGAIITANVETAPNGTMTADKMVEDTSKGYHTIHQGATISSTSAPVAVSVYVKPAGRTKLRLYVISTSSVGVNFDLSTMTATDYGDNVIYKSIKSVGNGWYRLEFAGTASFASTTVWAVIALLDNSGNFSYTGDGVSGVYIWGMQFEEKQYPTTYMATTSSTATRSPETLTIPTTGVLNPQEGTVDCRVYLTGDIVATTPSYHHQIFAHTTVYPNNRLGLQRYAGARNTWAVRSSDAQGNTTQLNVVWEPSIGWHYFTLRWSLSEIALFIDGKKIRSANNPYLPTSLASNCAIGYAPWSNSEYLNSLIAELRISSRARSDEEIAAAHASGQLPVDEWTTFLMRFDSNLNFYYNGHYVTPYYIIDKDSHLVETIDYNEYGTNKPVELIDDQNISPNTIYYYSVLTEHENQLYSSSLAQKFVPVTELVGYEQILWDLQPDIIKKNDKGDMKKFIRVIAKMLEYIHGQTKSLELLFDINQMPPEILKNIAEQMGWKLDLRLPLDVQRSIVRNITYFYRWSGTREGLDRLVKFYSGYPENTGIIEGSNKLLFSVRFIDGQVTFAETRCPKFGEGGDNFELIGTPEDPLFYCYDFKDTSRFNLTQSFTVYFRKPQNMTQEQIDQIISILNDVLEDNSPLGVNFDILVY